MTSDTKTLELDLMAFGPLKDFISESLVLRVPKGARTHDVLEELVRVLSGDSRFGPSERRKISEILAETAIARSDRILSASETLEESCRLALLPPVCGG